MRKNAPETAAQPVGSQERAEANIVNVAALIDELHEAHLNAVAELEPASIRDGSPSTIFQHAVEELRERGTPTASWPVWGGLLTLQLALIALPSRRHHDRLIISIAELCSNDPGAAAQVGGMLADHASPDDQWIAEIAARSIAKAKTPLADPASAIWALGFVGSSETLDLLLPLAARISNRLSALSLLSLVRCGIRAAEELVIQHLEKKPRPEIVEAAGLLRCRQALPFITGLATPESIRRKSVVNGDWPRTIIGALTRFDPGDVSGTLEMLFDGLNESNGKIEAATALARLGDGHAEAYLIGKLAEWTGRVIWGTEPLEEKWEALKFLASRENERAASLTHRWYGRSDVGDPGYPAMKGAADRFRMLQSLGAFGDSTHLDFLGWAELADREASEKGWALSVEARRASDRIKWREEQLARK